VWRKGTLGVPVRLFTLVLGGALLAAGQTPDWRKVGGFSVELMLASPATGPVDQVWFGPDGTTLYARTHLGKTFRTSDFETWSPAADAPEAPLQVTPAFARLPETRARVVAASFSQSRIYALGRQLFRSDDGGHTWLNLTAYRSEVVIGPGQRSVALSVADQDQVVVANDFGVWRSMDGGLSWTGLNQMLPNLPMRRIYSAPSGSAGTTAEADGMGTLELPAGGTVWQPARSAAAEAEAALKKQIAAQIGVEPTAVAVSGDVVYAGFADGRILVSLDRGAQYRTTREATGSRVERIFADTGVALAALSGKGPHILRTTNQGIFWDSLDFNLPADAGAHGITAERASGAVYVATDRGVFYGQADLDIASTNAVNWVNLSEGLAAAPATDVLLDAQGVQLYAALEGYGVYATFAPHRLRNPRVVNAADFSARPAAPGSLLSVIGGKVSSARGGDLDYPVLAVIGNASQIQVPFEAVGPNISLALETDKGLVRRDIAVQPVSPAILLGNDGSPMLWDAETELAIDARNAAHSAGRLRIWVTGLGKVRPDARTGVAVHGDAPPQVVASVKVFLNHAPVEVASATLLPDYVGFYVVEVQLPAFTNAGASDLYLNADGQDSNHVQVVIEP
jgi:uncharacterized protein (TIGR03437 family)